jgi:serine/threonine protein phosphatase PrpC
MGTAACIGCRQITSMRLGSREEVQLLNVAQSLAIEIYGESRPQRPGHNEDAFLISTRRESTFAALADGAGAAGGVAAKALIHFNNLIRDARSRKISSPSTWARWVRILDSLVSGSGEETTFVAIAITGNEAVGISAGNSRLYLVRREGGVAACRLLTGGATKSRLGSGRAEAFPIRQILNPGDTLLLLSDGCWTQLDQHLIRRIVKRARRLSEIPRKILDAAERADLTEFATRDNPYRDDATAVALRIAPPTPHLQSPFHF